MNHLARQIEELQGCEGDKDALDVADLQKQQEVLKFPSKSDPILQHA